MKFILILFTLLTFHCSANEDALSKSISLIPPEVEGVYEAGEWIDKNGKVKGVFRFILVSGGYEHVSSRLFIQWIVYETHSIGRQIIKTVEISEFDSFYSFGLPKKNKTRTEFLLDATHTYSNEEEIFTIIVGEVGEYNLSSNKKVH